jgi:hypothetical protein
MLHLRHLPPLLTLAATACLGDGTVKVAAPAAVVTEAVVLQSVPDTADRNMAAALGWTTGIPGAAIVLHLPDGDRTATSDAQGKVTLTGVEGGSYVIEVTRALTDAEAARVPAAEGALGFAVTTSVGMGGGVPPDPVVVPAARKRGLVISEWAFNSANLPGATAYSDGGYLELYNNGDTTVYLDGLVVGAAIAPYEESPGLGLTCSVLFGYFIDPGFLWTVRFERFPGRGREHPVAPGRTVVIATDAIDHRPIVANGLDLRGADFEFIGRSDVDNPGVPNMIEEGTPFLTGHGFYDYEESTVMFLAQSVAFAGLPQRRFAYSGDMPFYGIPRANILDVYSAVWKHATPTKACLPIVHPAFDRASATLFGDGETNAEFQLSAGRRVFIERNGEKYLLATHSSRSDFAPRLRSPGSVP